MQSPTTEIAVAPFLWFPYYPPGHIISLLISLSTLWLVESCWQWYTGADSHKISQLHVQWRHVGSLKWSMVGVLTPWKLTDAATQGPPLPREPLMKHLAALFTELSLFLLFYFKSSNHVDYPCRILFPNIFFPHCLKPSEHYSMHHLPTEWLGKLLRPLSYSILFCETEIIIVPM